MGLGIFTKVKIRYSYGRNKETLLECECLVDSTSLIGCNGRSVSVLEDRCQTPRLNLVVSAPSTPVPVTTAGYLGGLPVMLLGNLRNCATS